MATLDSIARPYAKAAYEFARAKKELLPWSTLLSSATEAIQEPVVLKALESPQVSPQQWFALLTEVLKPLLDENRSNFIRLLTENRRLYALPLIYDLFKEYEARDNQASEVEVTTAVPLDGAYQKKLIDKLVQVMKHQVSLRCLIDETILGGAIIRAGDRVIDGSIRGQLNRLLEFAIR